MANADSTQKDISRFQVRSYGWRKIDIGSDSAINILEHAYQTAKGIQGIVSALRQGMGDGDMDEGTLNHYQIDQLFSAVDQLSTSLLTEICRYASHLEKKIEDVEKSGNKKH